MVPPALAGFAFPFPWATGGAVATTAWRRVGIGTAHESDRFADLDGAADEALESTQGVPVGGGKKGDGNPVHIGPPGSPDAVDVVLGVGREIVIDHVGDSVDVDASSRDVGGHEDPDLAVLEFLEGPGPLVLGPVGMKGPRADATAPELLGHPVGQILGTGKDEHGIHLVVLQEMLEQADLLGLGDLVNELFDGVGGVGATPDFNGFRIVLKIVGELLDVAREGGGEKKGLAILLGKIPNDPSDVGEKAHVEHAIGLVENEELEARKICAALFHQAHEAPGGGDDQLHALAQGLFLGTFPHPAVDGRHAQRKMLGVGLDVVVNLDDQLAGRRNDQGPGLAVAGPILSEALEDGQHGEGKGRRLARPGLRDAGQVLALENKGDGFGLDGRWLFVAGLLDGPQYIGAKAHGLKRHFPTLLIAGKIAMLFTDY